MIHPRLLTMVPWGECDGFLQEFLFLVVENELKLHAQLFLFCSKVLQAGHELDSLAFPSKNAGMCATMPNFNSTF